MEQVKVTFPDGSVKLFAKGTRGTEILQEVPQKIRKQAIALKMNERLVDLTTSIQEDAKIEFVLLDQSEGMSVYWHSASHVMAHAVKDLFPEAKFGIGPAIDEGFYYDIEVKNPFTPEDLERIEVRMAEITQTDVPFIREELSQAAAIALFQQRNEPYKIELLQELKDGVSIYREGNFIDLCSGPHVPSTKYIKNFKLLSTSGAYWRGDEKNPMLQRIYGVAYPEKAQLEAHLNRLEEAKRRDHRKLGRELELFYITDEIGPGLILWQPKGAMMRKIIEDFWRDQHLKNGYELLFTPHIARINLWGTSGHLDFYRENMYSPMLIDEMEYQIKPMNCPFHLMIYKAHTRSYRDLPIRWAELGTVYRYERSGVLHGLMRVRGFTQDDAHIFCREDQLEEEVTRLLDFTFFMLRSFGFENFDVYLSTRPEKYVGSLENWELATSVLQKSLEKKQVAYQIDPGEGVFYGPKIDIKIKDVLGRAWQCSTIQVDFNLPERFDLNYKGNDGLEHRPIMVHRALLGSLERFFGVLIEHFAGAFPLWIAPIQVSVLPITDRQHEYAQKINQTLVDAGFRTKIDDRNEKIGYKIRDAETHKIPYMLVLGDKELEQGNVAVRKRGKTDLGVSALDDFISMLNTEVTARK
ncbi:threonine--tRNA ligase [candidate division KSB1 bacterium]|nr:threonine--tRNA ligase [candidate division KSB1 bacterium]